MIEQKDGTTLNLQAFQDIKINAPVTGQRQLATFFECTDYTGNFK